MPDITSCPKCDKKLRLPADLFGKNVRCPGCNLLFLARPDAGFQESAAVARERQASPPLMPARDDQDERFRRRDDRDDYDRRDDRDDYHARDRRREYYEDDRDRDRYYDDDYDWYREGDEEPQVHLSRVAIRWRWVYRGLGLVLLGALGLIATAVLGQLSNLIGLVGRASALNAWRSGNFGGGGGIAGGLSMLLAGLAVLGFLGWFVLTLVGMGMCMMVPVAKRTRSVRIFAILAFGCTIGTLAMWPLSIAAAFIAGPLVIVVFILALMVGLTAFVCWIFFLRDVAVADRGLGHDLIKFMIAVLVFPFVAFFVQLLFLKIFSAVLLIILWIVISLCSLALEGWYAWLVYQVRSLVDEKLPG